MKIAVVQGTRPEIIKNYSVVGALQRARLSHSILHTDQHSSGEMRDQIYAQMGYGPTRVMPGTYQLGAAINWLQAEYAREDIGHVIVNGDTAAALAGALSAMYSGIGVSHIEAGLRARDPFMLEERNRIMVDAVAMLLFAYTRHEEATLLASPDIRGKVYVCGNTTVDVLADFAEHLDLRPLPHPYVYATLHRREFTTSIERMQLVFGVLSEIASGHCPVILPLHPRTRDAVERSGMGSHLQKITTIAPLQPLQSLCYQKHAVAVMTDSGCVQEEAYMLGVPCVTIRDNTERLLTVTNRANRVTGFDRRSILDAFDWARNLERTGWPEIYGTPGVGERIVDCIRREMANLRDLPGADP